jgi:aspartyl-tRNA(Asn)/glutamyl-tRNA(Gln) amidotransferase subunit A
VLADDILSWSAADIAALYRSKRVSPVEVVTATFDRIDRLDRLYNAFVVIDREGALRDALASEERWRRGEPSGLLDGLPVTVKDLVLVKGMPTRRGSRTTSPVPSEEDGPPVARMRRHGAIFLGKTTNVGVRLEGGHGQSTHGSNSQSMGCALHIRREQRWRRSRGGIGPGNTASGDRWRRLHPHSRELLWSVRL